MVLHIFDQVNGRKNFGFIVTVQEHGSVVSFMMINDVKLNNCVMCKFTSLVSFL